MLFDNDHVIIQGMTYSRDGWQYHQLIARDTEACNPGRSDSTFNDVKPRRRRWISAVFLVRQVGLGESHFQQHARTHRVCQPNLELSPALRSVTHCAAPLPHGTSLRRPGVGCVSHLVMQACVRTSAETHTKTHSRGCNAFAIAENE